MDAYRSAVIAAIQSRNDDTIYNASIEHASIIIEEMFLGASQSIDIFTGRLNADVYGRDFIIDAAKEFLKKGHQLNVLFEENILDGDIGLHPFIRGVSQLKEIEVRRLKQELKKPEFHMILMDEDCFRFESDKRKPDAIAVFGNRKIFQNLREIYTSLWHYSDPVSVAP